MKKIVAVLLTCTLLLSLTACGLGNTAGKWTNDDLVFTTGSEEVVVPEGKAFIVYDDESYLTNYSDGTYEEYDKDFMTKRGLALGMTFEEFEKLYGVKNGYAVWEIYTGENNEYTNFEAYTKQSLSEMYNDTNNNVWLDLAFTNVNGKWEQLTDVETQDVWFCDADLNAFGEVVVFGVNFDEWGRVSGISLEHFNYDEAWVEWQGWVD